MTVAPDLPTIMTVILTALIDSINPCAIGVLILLVSTLLAGSKTKTQILRIGLIYIAAVYVTYFLAGLGLMFFLRSIPLWVSQYISIVVGSIVVFAGLIEIKDFFWYGKGFSLQIGSDKAKKIHKYMEKVTVPGVIFLGAFVAGVELPCTGGPYLAITLILSQNFNIWTLILLAIYNVIFVLPLVVILGMVFFGTKIQAVKHWKQSGRSLMRLAIGIILILLGWLLILIANNTISLI